jgi:hypothetical protein
LARRPTKLLLVEGHDDLISVVELMSAHIDWPEDKSDAPVQIKNCGGLNNLLDRDLISTSLKTPGLETIGILLDADDSGEARWASVKSYLSETIHDLPAALPPAGLIFQGANGLRVGVWIMPDNVRPGSLETFLSFLVPDAAQALWNLAKTSVSAAENLAMPCRDSHIGKAQLYTFLAWQDPPGQLSGRALTRKVLEPKSPSSGPFVEWFRGLYNL